MGANMKTIFFAAILLSISCGSKSKKSGGPDGGLGGTCTTSTECSAAFICAGGSCQLAGSVGLGGSCYATRDCDDETFCSPQGICAPTGSGPEGTECATAAECERGLVCEVYGFGGQCSVAGSADIGESCAVNGDCIAGLACGPDSTCGHASVVYPPFTGVECAEDEASFRAFFEVPRAGAAIPDFYRLPFPNDVRVSAAGELNMSDFPRPGQSALGVDIVDLYVDALVEDFTGFSGVAAVSIRFSKELEFDSVNTDSLHYIDITPGAPEFGQDRGRSWGYSTGRRLYNCQHLLTIASPSHQPLLPGHTYAVYLTTAIRAKDGGSTVQDADLVAALGASRPADADLGHAWDAYTPFRDYLADGTVNIAPNTIAAAAVFTVQDTTGRMERLAAAAQASAAPVLKDLTLCDGATTSPCEDSTGRGACSAVSNDFHEIHGRYSVPVYQAGTPPYETPAEGGGIEEVGGVPQQVSSVDVCFAMTIPKTTMPVAGWPLSVYAHGTGGSFTGAVQSGVATTLATASTPIAMFSFDGVVHGERRGASMRESDSLMFNVINPRAARDNNLQGAVDVVQALRIPGIGAQTLPGAGSTSFDTSSVFYMGHSQGSNVGVPAIATTELANAAVFSGAGAYLTQGILTKTSPVNAKASLEFLIGEELGNSHPVMVVWQTFFDSSDTLHYGPLLVRRPPGALASKNIYMSWSDSDTFSPEETLTVMARSIGLPVADPVIKDINAGLTTRPISANVAGGDAVNRTAALYQYAPNGFDGHFVALRNTQAVSDWINFLTSAVGGATPTVPAVP